MGWLTRLFFTSPPMRHEQLNLRRWFAMFCIGMACAAAMSLFGSHAYATHGSEPGRMLWWLGLYVFYFSLASTFVPLPTAWMVLYLASPDGFAALPPIARVIAVAAIGAMATGVSHVNAYHLITWLLRLGQAHKIRQTKLVVWAEKRFATSPFGLQIVFNILPLPMDPIRWLAVTTSYPLTTFFAAQAIGRFVRYLVFATAAVIFTLSIKQIAIIQVVLVAAAAGNMALRRVLSRRAPMADVDAVALSSEACKESEHA